MLAWYVKKKLPALADLSVPWHKTSLMSTVSTENPAMLII
jgi:hypothetical protein